TGESRRYATDTQRRNIQRRSQYVNIVGSGIGNELLVTPGYPAGKTDGARTPALVQIAGDQNLREILVDIAKVEAIGAHVIDGGLAHVAAAQNIERHAFIDGP